MKQKWKQRSNVLGWGVFFVLALFIFQCGGGGDAQGDPPEKPRVTGLDSRGFQRADHPYLEWYFRM